MERSKKEALVAELHDTFEKSNLVVVTHHKGLTVAEVSDLRQQMRAAGAGFKVTKNRLAKIALKGTKFEHLEDQFVGPTAVAYSEDAVAAAKVCAEFGKKNDKLEILSGGLNGQGLTKEQVDNLASLPSLDELRGKLIGLIQAPATKVAGVVQAPAGKLARVFAAYGSSE